MRSPIRSQSAKGRPTAATGPSAKVSHLRKGRPPREEAGTRRRERADELLRAAAIVLARRGIRAASMDLIAEELGIPKSVLYRYFPSKEELVNAILRRARSQWLALQAGPWRGLSANLREVIALARDNPSELLLLVKHCAVDPELRPYFDELHQSIVELTDRLLARASPPMAVDATMRQLAAQSVAGFIIDAVLWWIEKGDPARDAEFYEWTWQSLATLYRHWEHAPMPKKPRHG